MVWLGPLRERVSGQPKGTLSRREEQVEFSLVGQEEFEPQQDGHRVAGRILVRKLGKHRERPTEVRWLLGRQPDLHSTQVAALARPSCCDSRHWLPPEALMMNVEWDHGQRGARVDPAIRRGDTLRWQDGAAIQLKTQAGDGKTPVAD
jgi:hypothetical protein